MSEPTIPDMSTTLENGVMLHSIDDFTHISLDKSITSSTKSQYSQVVFHDLSDVYITDCDIICRYSLTDNLLPQAGDKIALFKVGWTSVSEYITFVRVPVEDEGRNSQVIFKAQTLPKDESAIYQLCYITSGNVMAGASTAFCFHKPHESELMAVADNSGMTVFKSRVSHLQEELQMKNEEHENLLVKHELLEGNYMILQKEFTKCEDELKKLNNQIQELIGQKENLASLQKEQTDKNQEEIQSLTTEISELEKQKEDWLVDKKVLEERLISYQQLREQDVKELEELKEKLAEIKLDKEKNQELMSSQHNLLETLKQLAQQKENESKSLDSLVQENQLLLEENSSVIKELQTKNQSLSSLQNLLDCVEKDLSTKQEELQKAVEFNKDLLTEKEQLECKLKKISEEHNKFVAEKFTVQTDLEKTIVVLEAKLKEKPQGEKDEEIYLLQAQLESLQNFHDKCEGKIQDYQYQIQSITEASETQIHQLQSEKRTLEIVIKTLKTELNQLKTGDPNWEQKIAADKARIRQLEAELARLKTQDPFTTLKGACSVGAETFMEFFDLPMKKRGSGDKSESGDKPKENNSSASTPTTPVSSDSLEKARKLQQEKMDIRSELVQVRHEKSELERVLLETREENAALKSRIKVLEYELGTIKINNLQNQKFNPNATFLDQIEKFNKNMPNIVSLNSFIAEQVLSLRKDLEKEKQEKCQLQLKVEDLLKHDAQMSLELQETTKQYKALSSSRNSDSTLSINTDVSSSEYQKLLKDKNDLEEQLSSLRASTLGKISVDLTKELHIKIDALQNQLAEKEKKVVHLAAFIKTLLMNNNQEKEFTCPCCESSFSAYSTFLRHFDSHLKN